jgi:hypothetical protein
MLLLRSSPALSRARRRGSALLMAFLVLILLAAILFQLYITTTTDARVARNDVTLTTMHQAIESALLEVYDRLQQDAEAGAAGTGEPGDPGAGAEPPGAAGAAPGADAAAGGAVDSREDSWGRPQRTTIGEIELRVQVQDEDSKLNVLTMLTADEEEAEKAFERVVRILDLCREDTSADIDITDARRLAEAMRDHFRRRGDSLLPATTRLSIDDDDLDRGLPMTLREMVVLEPFHAGLFRDFRDDRGRVVHSIGSFLTVWTSLQPLSEVQPSGAAAPEQQQAPGEDDGGADGAPAAPGDEDAQQDPASSGSGSSAAGIAVNINTAPAAVLKSLMDDRDVPYRFWDEVIEYRNLEEESEGSEDLEPIFDEYGNEVYPRRVFDSLDELEELGGWDRVSAEDRAELTRLIGTQSQVFSIYVTARRATGRSDDFGGVRGVPLPGEQSDRLGNAITCTVRSVIWRYQDGSEWRILPLVRWEVLDYTPFEVLDYPDPDR